jgi:hypothetical protein
MNGMNTRIVVGLMAAVALCGCHQANESKQATMASTASDAGGAPVTLVGCLVPGGTAVQGGAVGTSGNTGAAGFTLIDVTTTSAPSPDTSGAAGTSSTPANTPVVDTGTPRSYSLVGNKQDELQKYQNSKVEVSGAIVASTDTGTGVPDAGAAVTPAGTPATNVQRVRVDNVRQLDKTCTGANQSR